MGEALLGDLELDAMIRRPVAQGAAEAVDRERARAEPAHGLLEVDGDSGLTGREPGNTCACVERRVDCWSRRRSTAASESGTQLLDAHLHSLGGHGTQFEGGGELWIPP